MAQNNLELLYIDKYQSKVKHMSISIQQSLSSF